MTAERPLLRVVRGEPSAEEGGRAQLPLERFVDNLVDLATAMVTARAR